MVRSFGFYSKGSEGGALRGLKRRSDTSRVSILGCKLSFTPDSP